MPEIMIHAVSHFGGKVLFTAHFEALPPVRSIVRWKDTCYEVKAFCFDADHENTKYYMMVHEQSQFSWLVKPDKQEEHES